MLPAVDNTAHHSTADAGPVTPAEVLAEQRDREFSAQVRTGDHATTRSWRRLTRSPFKQKRAGKYVGE